MGMLFNGCTMFTLGTTKYHLSFVCFFFFCFFFEAVSCKSESTSVQIFVFYFFNFIFVSKYMHYINMLTKGVSYCLTEVSLAKQCMFPNFSKAKAQQYPVARHNFE